MIGKYSITRNGLFLLATALALAACGGGLFQSEQAAVRVWWLQPVNDTAQSVAADTPVPVILTVSVVPGLDNDRILTLSGDAELIPYAGAKWVENLPELVSSLVGRSLQASGRFEVVQRRLGRVDVSCELQLEVRRFFADRAAGAQTAGVSVEIGGRYQCGADTARLLESQAYIGVNDERMNVIVASFQKALDQVTVDLISKI